MSRSTPLIPPCRGRAAAGLTLVELLVTIGVVGILLALAVPSFNDMIARQRVRGVNAELVTDLQLVRTEAVRRSTMNAGGVTIAFSSTPSLSCYSIFVQPGLGACDCRQPAASRCFMSAEEIKTVQVPAADGVTLGAAPTFVKYTAQQGTVPPIAVNVVSARSGRLLTQVSPVGRVQVCSPDGSITGVPACPPPPSP